MTNTKTLASVTTALVGVARGVDNAIAKAGTAKADWSAFCAAGLVGDKPSLTLDAIGEAMLEACKAKCTTKREAAKLERVSHLAKHGFSTAYGWLMDLRRVHEAGLTVLLLETCTDNNGKPYALTELRRGTDPRQPKRTSKPAKGASPEAPPVEPTPNATAPADPTLLTLQQIADQLTADAKRLSFKALRNMQPELSRILQAVTQMTRTVENGIAAEAKAKAAKAAKAPAKRRKAA